MGGGEHVGGRVGHSGSEAPQLLPRHGELPGEVTQRHPLDAAPVAAPVARSTRDT